MDPSNQKVVVVDKSIRFKVFHIFSNIITIGERLGFTLGDITCGNIMTDGSQLYLIDYEVITFYPLEQDYIWIWNNTIRGIFGQD